MQNEEHVKEPTPKRNAGVIRRCSKGIGGSRERRNEFTARLKKHAASGQARRKDKTNRGKEKRGGMPYNRELGTF